VIADGYFHFCKVTRKVKFLTVRTFGNYANLLCRSYRSWNWDVQSGSQYIVASISILKYSIHLEIQRSYTLDIHPADYNCLAHFFCRNWCLPPPITAGRFGGTIALINWEEAIAVIRSLFAFAIAVLVCKYSSEGQPALYSSSVRVILWKQLASDFFHYYNCSTSKSSFPSSTWGI